MSPAEKRLLNNTAKEAAVFRERWRGLSLRSQGKARPTDPKLADRILGWDIGDKLIRRGGLEPGTEFAAVVK